MSLLVPGRVCRYIPESLQSSIMTIFRVPLNILVVIGTKVCSDGGVAVPLGHGRAFPHMCCSRTLQMEETAAPATVFYTCAAWFGLGCVFQVALTLAARKSASRGKKQA